MTIVAERIPGEPVVSVRYNRPLDPLSDPRNATEVVAALARDIDTRFFRITDYSAVEMDFEEAILVLGGDTGLADPRTSALCVGINGTALSLLHSLSKQTNTEIRVFDTVEEALEFARHENPLQTQTG